MKTETENEVGARRKITLVLLGIAVALILAFVADAWIAGWLAAHASHSLKRVMLIVSRAGDWPTHVGVGLAGLGVAAMVRNREWVRIFLAMLVACALAGIAARAIKIASGRARPSARTEAAWNGLQLHSKYNAFPSGHTAASSGFFGTLFLVRRRIGAPFLVIPAAIAVSRMVVGAHYFSDVIFAVILGVSCAILALRWVPAIPKLKSLPYS